MRGLCPVTFDVEEDGSRQWNATSRPAESCIRCVSPEAVEDLAEQQREPNQSQTDLKPQTSLVGVEDVDTEQERSSRDVENAAADETDSTAEGDVKVYEKEADMLESSQGIPGGLEGDGVEEKQQQLTAQRSVPESDDPCERPRSVMSSPEPAAAANGGQTCETVTKAGVGELDDDDVGIGEESPEQDANESELKDEAAEKTEEGNPERSCSAKPDLDSSFTLSKPPEKLISRISDHHARKRESRSLRYMKVLQASVVTQLKW